MYFARVLDLTLASAAEDNLTSRVYCSLQGRANTVRHEAVSGPHQQIAAGTSEEEAIESILQALANLFYTTQYADLGHVKAKLLITNTPCLQLSHVGGHVVHRTLPKGVAE